MASSKKSKSHTPSAAQRLKIYRAKRDFDKTQEPSTSRASKGGQNSYLIQKHAARRLHYDFRLELNGVLKSWAVTRGPSLDPEDKRLAVHVEDHPLAYGTFEGTIAQGEYGGGTVMLWDNGSWAPLGDAESMYAKGNLTFELHGQRLKGRWHLVRMHGYKHGDSKRDNWLLIKGKDKYAKAGKGDAALEQYKTSVTSSRPMEKIAKGNKVWGVKSEKKPKDKKPDTVKQSLNMAKKKKNKWPAPPDFISPQLATLVDKPPVGKNWVHEIKFDGYRLLARIDKGAVSLSTRNENDWTKKFPELARDIGKLNMDNALLDGEIVCRSDDGTMSFHGLQNALKTGKRQNLHYHVFDLLFLNGQDMCPLPLKERKQALKKILPQTSANIHYSEHFTEPGGKVLQHACQIALEGIVSKRIDGPYRTGRTTDWLKSKCSHEQEIVIGGYTMQPKHDGLLGALLMGYYRDSNFIFAGKVGTGFSNVEGREILKKLKSIETKKSPFEPMPTAAKRGALWVKPQLVAQIHFAEWTPENHMRHPSFQGLREDKPAQEVVREKEKKILAGKQSKKKTAKIISRSHKASKIEVAGVVLSHSDKVLYANKGITKLDLAHYYERIAPLILPQIAYRPISLMRCPEGEGKPCFFQRHGSDTLSPFVKPVRVKGHGDNQPFLMVEDIRGLIALVQMGVLELHVWGSQAKNPDKPDRVIFDLDPAPDVPFSKVKQAALNLRARMKSIKLDSFLKVTGGKGLHVVVPIKPGPSWSEVKAFSHAVADALVQTAPDDFTANNRKDKRNGKIYIDYLRNSETASAIAPYSTRARDGAPVALPIAWEELKNLKAGNQFTMLDAIKRIQKNPWKDILKVKQALPKF